MQPKKIGPLTAVLSALVLGLATLPAAFPDFGGAPAGAEARSGSSAVAQKADDRTPSREPVRECTDLTSTHIPGGTVASAVAVTADATTPSSCRVRATFAHEPANDLVTVWVYLPSEDWNGRFEGVGGGGFSGGSESSLLAPLKQGYAAAATDAGSPGTDASFFLNPDRTINWQVADDWGYLGIHEMTVAAQSLVAAYYGRAADHSYFNGCSTGGRQGLTEAQRYPDDYDGILAGSPVINYMQSNPAQMWPQLLMLENDDEIPACKAQAVVDAVVAACDTVGDGVEDGVIGDPLACTWDPSELIGTPTPCGTITKTDADIIRQIWRGARTRTGEFMWYGILPGARLSGIAGTTTVDGELVGKPNNPKVIGNWLYQDPSWDWTTLTQASYEQAFTQGEEEWAVTQSSNDPDLSAFAKKGGKILMWHGLADFGVMPQGSMDYYNRVSDTMGAGHAKQFMRLFMAPGVDHCGGGSGPQPTGQFDALVDWVEKGKAPKTIDGVKTDAATGKVVQTRPICTYPGVARYTGRGDVDDAANYRCVQATESGTRAP